ncbi:hypothetical protein PIB30_019041 [Stylosanthes scabra]|uniref:Uncharacterized protein n=1 Tax=Stylosanthes scabra TaxID=79078 RepID=A0ABU6S7Y1_9FABA|nr:hypothetical protein [Stylosanthes scabra]
MNLLPLPLAKKVYPDIEVKEQQQNRSVEDGVEDPRANPIAATFEEEVQQENANVAGKVATEEGDLAVEDEGKAGAAEANCGPELVTVDEGVDEGGEEDCKNLKGLREFEPQKRHEGGDGVVKHLKKQEPPTSQDCDDGGEHVEEAGEVVEVGPEEDASRGASAEWEAKKPLQGGFGAAPEPPGVADLGGGGEECAREDCGGEEGHG